MLPRTFAGLVIAVAVSAGALAAQPALEFEVASIRPSGPLLPAQGQSVSAGVHIDGSQFRASMLAFRDYLTMAYNVRIYQVEGPDWIASERFEINAKMPELPDGSNIDEKGLADMMRALLEQRFALKTHRESKEFPVYALKQTKDGIQAKENALGPESKEGVTIGGSGSSSGTAISLGRGSTLSVGGNKIEATKVSMQVLADLLARFVDKPVVDQTGLAKTYDIALELVPEDFQALMIRSAIAAGVTLPPQALRLLDTASGDSLHEALAKVGLKLESTKLPLDVIVVDSVNRTPSEN